MTLATMLTEDVTILRAGTTTDRAGDIIKSWASPASTAAKCFVETKRSDEDEFRRFSTDVLYLLFFSVGTDVQSGDRVVWGSITMEVIGKPMKRLTPKGVHHLEVAAREFTG